MEGFTDEDFVHRGRIDGCAGAVQKLETIKMGYDLGMPDGMKELIARLEVHSRSIKALQALREVEGLSVSQNRRCLRRGRPATGKE